MSNVILLIGVILFGIVKGYTLFYGKKDLQFVRGQCVKVDNDEAKFNHQLNKVFVVTDYRKLDNGAYNYTVTFHDFSGMIDSQLFNVDAKHMTLVDCGKVDTE